MAHFKAKRADGRSYKTVVVDLLKEQDYGSLWTYETIAAALDLDPVEQKIAVQHTVRNANKTLLKLHKRGLQNVPTVGYRIIQANEHVTVANAHQSKADKAMSRALQFYHGTDLSRLTENERRLHHGQHMLAEAIAASHHHLDKRIKRIEELLDGTTTINPNPDPAGHG